MIQAVIGEQDVGHVVAALQLGQLMHPLQVRRPLDIQEMVGGTAQQHREEVDTLIQDVGPAEIPSEDEEDDEAEFQADLDELFERDAELFRRLAQ